MSFNIWKQTINNDREKEQYASTLTHALIIRIQELVRANDEILAYEAYMDEQAEIDAKNFSCALIAKIQSNISNIQDYINTLQYKR